MSPLDNKNRRYDVQSTSVCRSLLLINYFKDCDVSMFSLNDDS